MPSDILPTVRPESLSVNNASVNNDDTEDLEAEDSSPDLDADTQSMMDDGILVADEERRSGVVRLSVYWSYWIAVGRCLAAVVFLSILLMQGAMFSMSVVVNVACFVSAYYVVNNSISFFSFCVTECLQS